jgi:hypothetical protein
MRSSPLSWHRATPGENEEITTSHFLNPALRMPENKTFVILPAAFTLLQSPLLRTGSA